MPGLTPTQRLAVETRGNVLVIAGAGTGKTRTLVERCLERLLDPVDPVSLEAVLVVTFTEAAAAECRHRIRQRLEAEVVAHPEDLRRAEQLALADSARIGTLHGFCLQLVREHFAELDLDPQLVVLDESQSAILAARTLDDLLERHYIGASETDQAVQDLVLTQGGGRDERLRALVGRVHAYTQTLPDPAGWLRAQLEAFAEPEPRSWPAWLEEGAVAWRSEWLETLAAVPADNERAEQCRTMLEALPAHPTRAQLAAALERLSGLDGNWPKGKKTSWRKPLDRLFQDAAFLGSLASAQGDQDPLVEDWNWVRPPLTALLALVQEFAAAFATAKRELAALDFHDLEQFALQLLWDRARGEPTALARQWQQRLDLLFVDEYQDINAAQDCILRALSRDGPAANRFLVGDVKQSIYRFRLANPRIFQDYAAGWRADPTHGTVIALNENFRSRPPVLEFVNALFTPLMQPAVGGVAYDEDARLRAGQRESAPTGEPGGGAAVELLLRLKTRRPAGTGRANESGGDEEAGDETESDERSDAEQEAALVAERLQALKALPFQVWDEPCGQRRPVEWRDMVVLLRAPSGKAEVYAKVFAAAGIPLAARRTGLYQALEVSDLLSLLELLDNPLQDLPALAVLRSPLVGLTVNELAVIRLTARSEAFWTALAAFHHQAAPGAEPPDPTDPVAAARASAWPKADRFLERFGRWREMARLDSLSHCLETVLDETGYEDQLLAQPRGAQRVANLQRLLALTRDFDRLQRQGLFRFLRFIEAQRAVEFDPEPAPAEEQDVVRLMSVHQSKGLEFPVVVVADLGKAFNLRELSAGIVLDERYGLAPLVKPPGRPRSYPSLPHWLAARRGRHEALGEELRLLYVATTRACEKLVLVGTTSRSRVERDGSGAEPADEPVGMGRLLAASSCLDWLGPLLPRLTGCPDWLEVGQGQGTLLDWRVIEQVGEAVTAQPAAEVAPPAGARLLPSQTDQAAAQEPRGDTDAPVVPVGCGAGFQPAAADVSWTYPHEAATLEPAKASVTGLRRRALEVEEATHWFRPPIAVRPYTGPPEDRGASETPIASPDKDAAGWKPAPHTEAAVPGVKPAEPVSLTGAERGVAHHRFFEFVALDALGSRAAVEVEVERLRQGGRLSAAEAGALDLEALTAFGQSELGQRLRAQAAQVRRELEFTVRLSPADFAALGLPCTPGLDAEEFVVVQGVVDLALVGPDSIEILDFKTDQVTRASVGEKVQAYTPQLRLYALALSRLFARPVTGAWLHFLAIDETVPVSV